MPSSPNSCRTSARPTGFILGTLLAAVISAPLQAQWNPPGNYTNDQTAFDLIIEDISAHGDITGSATCNGSFCGVPDGDGIVFINGCDGELIPYWLPGGGGSAGFGAGRALDSDRNMYGALMVVGLEMTLTGIGSFTNLPTVWHFDRTEGQANMVRLDLSGLIEADDDAYFSSVAADDENQRWVVIGRARKPGTFTTGPVTLSIPYATNDSGGPEVGTIIVDGPTSNPRYEAVTGCGKEGDVTGTVDHVWDIESLSSSGASSDLFGVAGSSDADFGEGDTLIIWLATRDLIGFGGGLLMPNQDEFLVTPSDWVCYDEATDIGYTDFSTDVLHAFDTLSDGSLSGSLGAYLDSGEYVFRGWLAGPGSENVDVMNDRLDPIGDRLASSIAMRADIVDLDGSLETRIVGLSRSGLTACEPEGMPLRVAQVLSVAGICHEVDRAVEWGADGSTPFDLNQRIRDDATTLVSAHGMNRGHQIVGLAYSEENGYFGYLLNADDTLVNLDALGAEVTTACSGDVNGDGRVDGVDLGMMLAAWGAYEGACRVADLNCDGTVDGADFGTMLASWGCEQCLQVSTSD